MTIKRVKAAAENRDLYFSGKKAFLNSMVGAGYEIYIPNKGFFQSDTLTGIYEEIMKYPKVKGT